MHGWKWGVGGEAVWREGLGDTGTRKTEEKKKKNERKKKKKKNERKRKKKKKLGRQPWQRLYHLVTAAACKMSRLKDARTRLQTVYFPVL